MFFIVPFLLNINLSETLNEICGRISNEVLCICLAEFFEKLINGQDECIIKGDKEKNLHVPSLCIDRKIFSWFLKFCCESTNYKSLEARKALNAIHPADSPGHMISQISEISCDFVELDKIPSFCFLSSYLVACTVHYL